MVKQNKLSRVNPMNSTNYDLVNTQGWDTSNPDVLADRMEESKSFLRLARPTPQTQPSISSAFARSSSTNHGQLRQVAKQILDEAGLSPSDVSTVIHSDPDSGIRSGVLSVIRRRVSPKLARYVAAWYGLLSGEKKLTVFHPSDGGEDTLHILNSHLPPDQLTKGLQESNLPSFSVESLPNIGSRAYVFNPLGRQDLDPIAESLNASHTKLRGYGYRIGVGEGSGPDTGSAAATSRKQYRNIISDFETATKTSNE